MIDRFLRHQKEQLEQSGLRQKKAQENVDLESNRLSQLIEFRDSMPTKGSVDGLYLQQRQLMKDHLQGLVENQKQAVHAARTDYEMARQSLLSQYRRVRGFEVVQKRREKRRLAAQQRQEEEQIDDWLNQPSLNSL